MIRSTPSSSGSGNITPASTTIVVSPQVSASMLIPNSPSPPSATTSSILTMGVRTNSGDTPGGVDPVTGSRRGGSVRLLGAPEKKRGGMTGAGSHKTRPTYNLDRETIAQLIALVHRFLQGGRIRGSTGFPDAGSRPAPPRPMLPPASGAADRCGRPAPAAHWPSSSGGG